MHWSQKYLSVEYKNMNCSSFVEHLLRDHFKKEFTFPQSEGSLFNQSAQIKKSVPSFCFSKLENIELADDGDLVLMHGIRNLCHVGMFVRISSAWFILHCEKRMGRAALHKESDLFRYGYRVEGIYKWLR